MPETRRTPVLTTPETDNLRQHERTSHETELHYRIKKAAGAFSGQIEGRGTLLNLSEGGLLFSVDCKLNHGSILKLSMLSSPAPTLASDTVRILRADKTQDCYQIAAEFV